MTTITDDNGNSYQLSNNPLRVYSVAELPDTYQLSNWESDTDSWIKRDREFYNLREFCTIGMPRITGPYGGWQLATGEFLIASHQGEVYIAR